MDARTGEQADGEEHVRDQQPRAEGIESLREDRDEGKGEPAQEEDRDQRTGHLGHREDTADGRNVTRGRRPVHEERGAIGRGHRSKHGQDMQEDEDAHRVPFVLSARRALGPSPQKLPCGDLRRARSSRVT